MEENVEKIYAGGMGNVKRCGLEEVSIERESVQHSNI